MILADVGYLCLVGALTLALYSSIIPLIAVKYNNWNLIRSAQLATTLTFLMILGASAVLVTAFVTSDFSLLYVWEHSSTDMPLFYKVTAFWGGMNGSLLLWGLIQSGFAVIVVWAHQKDSRVLMPYLIVILNVIIAFLLVLLLGWSNPLSIQMMVPLEGRGLNPLLQNPGMVIHPPSLYLGFISFSVPFAFGMASLIAGKLDNDWLLSIRRWTLFGWYFLTVGLFLGGQWAYEELGWGGYWAWDPVENAALMPWFTGTAFLHSAMVQEKRKMLRIWNMVLVLTTFSLSILGTFLTRSGIINSVHSFAQSEVGPAFLVFLAIILFVGIGLIFWRVKGLESQQTIDSILCKENVFLIQNILLVSLAFTVLLGTTFPLLSEAIRGTKLSIQAPFFSRLAAPMGMLLFFLMGIGTLIAWRRSSVESLRKNFLLPILIGAATLVALAIFFPSLRLWQPLIILGTAAFVTSTVVIELIKGARAKALQWKTNGFHGLFLLISQNRRRYGGLTAHMGVVLIFIGFAGRYIGVEKDITLTKGQKASVGGYEFQLKGVDEFMVRNATHRAATVEVFRNGKSISILKPAKSFYPTQPDPLTEVAIERSVIEDLYLVFATENIEQEQVTLKVYINPLVFWAWLSLFAFTLGMVICVSYSPPKDRVI